MKIEIINSTVVRHSENYYITFPWVATNDNRIYLVYRKAGMNTAKNAKSGSISHHDTDSCIAMIYSEDFGVTWARDEIIIYRSRYGVNDPAVTIMPGGSLLIRISEIDVKPTNLRHELKGVFLAHRPDLNTVSAAVGNIFVELDTELKIVRTCKIEAGNLTESISRDPILVLEDNTWVLPVYAGAPFSTDKSYLIRSYNDGKDWLDTSVIAADLKYCPGEYYGINFNETGLLNYGKGEMLAAIRADSLFSSDEFGFMNIGGVGNLYFSKSFNYGIGWSIPVKSNFFGQPGHLLHDKDKSLTIVTFGVRKSPYSISVGFSDNKGINWTESHELIATVQHYDMGYPVTVKSTGEQYNTFYYDQLANGDRVIKSVIWKIC
jgi:hypothetical protein